MNEQNTVSKIKVEEEIKELVIARIEATMSPHLKLAIGGDKSLTKQEMIEDIKKGNEVGRLIIQSHLNFIKAQASGKLITALNSVK